MPPRMRAGRTGERIHTVVDEGSDSESDSDRSDHDGVLCDPP